MITPSGSSERPVDDAPESACQLMQEFTWECEQSGWKRGDCQATDLLLRCGVDVTIVNPTDEGFACPKDASDSDAIADAGASVLLHLCGAEIAHPLPGEDPCGSGGAGGGGVLSGPSAVRWAATARSPRPTAWAARPPVPPSRPRSRRAHAEPTAAGSTSAAGRRSCPR